MGLSTYVRAVLLCGCSAAAFGAAASAHAQAASGGGAQLQEIVVTAQRRAERLENVPMSVSAVTPQVIAQSGAQSIHDLSQLVAGAQVNFAGCCTQPAIRGISTLTTGVGFENNVAIYVDGFYEPDNVSINSDLANISSLEVLKGPQGTLWGRNATGGAILINTKPASKTLTGDIEAGYGRFNERLVSGYISGPINDRVRYSLAGYYRKSDGYNKLVTPAGVTLSDKATPISQASVRTKLEADVTDNLTATLAYNYGLSYDGRGNVFQVFDHASALIANIPRSTDPYKLAFNVLPVAGALVNEGTVKLAYQTPIGTVTSYTGYAHRRTELNFDFDSTPQSIIDSVNHYVQDTFQQTVDYNVTAIKNLDLVVGGYYYHDQLKDLGTQNISGFRVVNIQHWREQTRAWALYADGTYHFTDQLSLNAGARYSEDHRNIYTFVTAADNTTITVPRLYNEAAFSAFTPRASLRYEIAPRSNVYVSYSKGYRTGGFQPTPGVPLVPYAPEKITSYEIGFKTAQSNYRFSIAAFHYSYHNLQVGITIPNPDPRVGGVLNLTLNAKEAEDYGIDSEFEIEPIEHLHVRAGAAWLHARYTDFKNATNVGLVYSPAVGHYVNSNTILYDWSGLQMARAPKFAGNLGADYEFQNVINGGKMLVASNLTYTDSYPISNPSVYGPSVPAQWQRDQRFLGKAHSLLNASMTWTDASDHYKVSVYANNLTDVRYRITYNGNAATGDYNSWSEPRTYGFRVGYSF
jgi:iron complex outermembrane receptor protein